MREDDDDGNDEEEKNGIISLAVRKVKKGKDLTF